MKSTQILLFIGKVNLSNLSFIFSCTYLPSSMYKYNLLHKYVYLCLRCQFGGWVGGASKIFIRFVRYMILNVSAQHHASIGRVSTQSQYMTRSGKLLFTVTSLVIGVVAARTALLLVGSRWLWLMQFTCGRVLFCEPQSSHRLVCCRARWSSY